LTKTDAAAGLGVLSKAAKRKRQVATPGVLAKAAERKQQAQNAANEDIGNLPANRMGAGGIQDDPLLRAKKKRKYKLTDVLNVKPTENDMSESIGPAAFIQVMQGSSSEWRDFEVIPPSYQVLSQRLSQISRQLGPGFRVRGIDARSRTSIDIATP
jgi:hypothetical protein